MKIKYCWRCQGKSPFLDEEEFYQVVTILERFKNREFKLEEYHRLVLDTYYKLTGVEETNTSVIWHHQLKNLGPDCQYCGKPLRTPQAKLCAFCWKEV